MRAGDRLTNPPRRIGREFIAAAVFELIDRLHQADVAFLDEVEELQAAVGVFLGDGDHEAQIRLDHLLLRLARLALALLHHMHDLAELLDLEARLGGQRVDLAAQLLDRGPSPWRRIPSSPASRAWTRAAIHFGSSSEPWNSSRKSSRRDAVRFGEAQQLRLVADQPLVDVVELLDQRLDAVLVQRERLHVGDDLFLELLVLALLRRRQRLVLELVLDVLVLQATQLLVGVGDAVEGLQNLGLELGLHGGERDGILHVVLLLEGLLAAARRRRRERRPAACAGAVGGRERSCGVDRRLRRRSCPRARRRSPRGR